MKILHSFPGSFDVFHHFGMKVFIEAHSNVLYIFWGIPY